jgi:hypothetical protein
VEFSFDDNLFFRLGLNSVPGRGLLLSIINNLLLLSILLVVVLTNAESNRILPEQKHIRPSIEVELKGIQPLQKGCRCSRPTLLAVVVHFRLYGGTAAIP